MNLFNERSKLVLNGQHINEKMKEKIIKIISIISKISIEELKQNADLPKMWPSLIHFEIIIALEEEFDIRFDADDIAQMNTVNEIIQYVSNQLS